MDEQRVQCPYCGEMITLVIDGSVSRQSYVEDCSVCCRPIMVSVTLTDNAGVEVSARQENG